MIVGMECVPELKVDNLSQIGTLSRGGRSVSTLEVMTISASELRHQSNSEFRNEMNIQRSSRFTSPSAMARRTPSPASFSLP